MLPIDKAPAAASGILTTFLEQLDMPNRRRSEGLWDPVSELQQLGLLPEDGAEPVWEMLNDIDWFILLRGIASRSPALASVLASHRFAADHATGLADLAPGRCGWALNASRLPDHSYQLVLPLVASSARQWCFVDAGQVISVPSTSLKLRAARNGQYTTSCGTAATREAGSVDPALRHDYQRDALALTSGTLWRLVDCTSEHAANRPMFARQLADFPTMQLRLIALHERLVAAEELADLALANWGPKVVERLRREAEGIRIEAQQICGGNGYMAESAFARTLVWLEWSTAVLRHCVCPEIDDDDEDPLDLVETRVRRRLERFGTPPVWDGDKDGRKGKPGASA